MQEKKQPPSFLRGFFPSGHKRAQPALAQQSSAFSTLLGADLLFGSPGKRQLLGAALVSPRPLVAQPQGQGLVLHLAAPCTGPSEGTRAGLGDRASRMGLSLPPRAHHLEPLAQDLVQTDLQSRDCGVPPWAGGCRQGSTCPTPPPTATAPAQSTTRIPGGSLSPLSAFSIQRIQPLPLFSHTQLSCNTPRAIQVAWCPPAPGLGPTASLGDICQLPPAEE